jgi:hypothetical protein
MFAAGPQQLEALGLRYGEDEVVIGEVGFVHGSYTSGRDTWMATYIVMNKTTYTITKTHG